MADYTLVLLNGYEVGGTSGDSSGLASLLPVSNKGVIFALQLSVRGRRNVHGGGRVLGIA